MLQFTDLGAETPGTDVVVEWIFAEWTQQQGLTREATRAKLLLSFPDCPCSQIAWRDGAPVGFIWLNRYQAADQAALTVWNNGLLVPPAYRHQGIASALVRHAESLVASHASELFAYTEIPEFYLRLGWRVHRDRDGDGGTVVRQELESGVGR